MKKRTIIMTMCGMLAATAASADTVTSYPYFSFQTIDGNIVSVKSESLTMTIANGKLIVGNGAVSHEFSVTNLGKMYFSTEKSGGVDDTEWSDADTVKDVYSISGVFVGSYSDLSTLVGSLQPGMYIVKSNGKTQKIAVK